MKKVLTVLLFILLLTGTVIGQNGNKSKVLNLDMAGFKSKISSELTLEDWKFKGSRPVVVDFYATWCAPCKKLAPILEQVATEYSGKVDFYKVDVDKSGNLASMFGIKSIPTLLFIPMDGEPELMEGAPSKAELKKLIEYCLLTD